MEKGRRLLFWVAILFVFAAASIFSLESQRTEALAISVSQARVDIITIDTLAKFDKLELPGVTFQHDQHTDALSKQGKKCTVCHVKDAKGQLSIKFKRLADNDAQMIKTIYHENCIGCHKEMVAAGQKTGPLDGQCRSCHTAKPIDSAWKSIAFDKSLHFRHISATGGEEKCQTCHHSFDNTTMQLVSDKGKEQNCRDCHEKTAQVVSEKLTISSFGQAAHKDCVACHMNYAEQQKNTGPVRCAGCHSSDSQAQFKRFKEVPRLKRGQPDATLLVAMKGGKAMANIGPVAFDHKAHEGFVNDCRSCHVGKGSMDGKYFEYAGDMHLKSNMQGCIGCHSQTQNENQVCAGCHSQMAENKAPSETSCNKCHTTSLAKLYADGKTPEKEVMYAAATAVIAERNLEVKTIDEKDIPEFISIDALTNEYQPSQFPHRKIVKSLLKGMQGNKMAGYFHGQGTLMCQGCHHRSPASKTPPKCASCHHKKPFDPARPDMPSLKAAYHGQCMGCHAAMKLQKPVSTTCSDAQGCHLKK